MLHRAFIVGVLGESLGGSFPAVDLLRDDLATGIRAAYDDARGNHALAIDGYLRVGRLLLTAQAQLPSTRAYGAWFRTANLGFSTERGRQLRFAAAHEQEVRQWATAEIEAGHEPTLSGWENAHTRAAPAEAPAIASVVAMNHLQSERRIWVGKVLGPLLGRGDVGTRKLNKVDATYCAYEDEQKDAVLDTLASLLPDLDRDDLEKIVAAVLRVLRGE